MATPKDPWTFLKNQQERLVLVASLLALGVGVVNSFLDKANPPTTSLAVCSALVVGMGVWMCLALQPSGEQGETGPLIRHRRYSRGQIAAAWIGGALLLAAAWGFLYRDHLRYSTLADRLLGGPRVVVSSAVAWQVLRYPTPAGENSSTVADELASLLAGLPYRVVVMRAGDIGQFKATARDGFIVDGRAEGLGLVLNARLGWLDSQQERRREDLAKTLALVETRLDSNTSISPVLAIRFLPNPFLASSFMVEAPLTVATSGEHRSTVARLLLRYALATRLYHDGHAEAARLFRDIVAIGQLLPPMTSTPLAGIYKATGYYLAVHQQELDAALNALALAQTLAPADQELKMMHGYLLLLAGQMGQAGELIERLSPSPEDAAAVHALQGEYWRAVGRSTDAIQAYERALQRAYGRETHAGLTHL
jgi:hypothetical protein